MSTPKVEHITAAEAAARLAAEAPPLLLDVRTPGEWSLARIEGAVHLPMDRLPRALGDLDPERPTIVVCHHGVRSMQVALWLSHKGFASVANLGGGIEAWSREVDPEVPRY